MSLNPKYLFMFLLATALPASTSATAQDAPAGQNVKQITATVKDLAGTVDAFIAASGEWIEATSGAKYIEKDALSTDKKSWTVLEFHDKNLLKVGEKTELTIRKLYAKVDTGDEQTEIDLTKGQILNRVRDLPTSGSIYTIHTPTATSSVRGTRFAVRVFQKKKQWITEVKVLDGIVEVTDKTGKVLKVTDGEQTEISELGVPDKAEKMSQRTENRLDKDMRNAAGFFDTTTEAKDEGLGESVGDLEDSVNTLEDKVDTTLEGIEVETEEPAKIDNEDDNDDDLFPR